MTTTDRWTGCLLGLAVGDAVGAPLEGQPSEQVRARYPDTADLVARPPLLPDARHLVYTDDTQMMIGVAETLRDHGDPTAADYARAYAANYQPWRGYGMGARQSLQALLRGDDVEAAARIYFSDGSFGNGAAMRVAPIGVRYATAPEQRTAQAARSSAPTHCHPLAIEGARMMAAAVAAATTTPASEAFVTQFMAAIGIDAVAEPYRAALHAAHDAARGGDLRGLPCGVAALEAVPTAIACFAAHPDSYAETVGSALRLGGDTDTIAAMAGAISGARLGVDAIPAGWLELLEPDGPKNDGKGHEYLRGLAAALAKRAEPPQS